MENDRPTSFEHLFLIEIPERWPSTDAPANGNLWKSSENAQFCLSVYLSSLPWHSLYLYLHLSIFASRRFAICVDIFLSTANVSWKDLLIFNKLLEKEGGWSGKCDSKNCKMSKNSIEKQQILSVEHFIPWKEKCCIFYSSWESFKDFILFTNL